ncbi:hypothetical protein B5M09_001008 [Aphanomyces astaci]|uniref:DDE-1 domain-containing protein n=1 Tax=Aphanomyces astaci TaxID=112090 RepID=A0A425D7S7_APHAT|nr:hypothetical protein B5M09_001008 [Aphanomyces astaci]
MSDYEVSEQLEIRRRTIPSKRDDILAYEGNKKRMTINPGGRRETFPDPTGLVEFIAEMRDCERALTTTHIINFIKRYQSDWLRVYFADKQPDAIPLRHANQAHLVDSWWGDAKVSSGEKHILRMTVALTVRADGTKLPLLFVVRRLPDCRIETHQLPTLPTGHVYAVQPKEWMDNDVLSLCLRSLLLPCMEATSVILVDNFESHMSDESYHIFRDELNSLMGPLPPNATSTC